MQKQPSEQEFTMQQAMQLAKTKEGQQLIALLQSQGGNALQEAMAKASAGDYTQAKELLQTMLQNPQLKDLMEKLGRK